MARNNELGAGLIPELPPAERAVLIALSQIQNAALARRARLITLASDGHSTEEIAQQVGLSTRTVSRWLADFRDRGLGIFPEEAVQRASQTSPSAVQSEGAVARPVTLDELCQRYHVDMAHARHVGKLAAELFDLTAAIHELDEQYRKLVYQAGLLHNIAFAGGAAGHHTRGRDILLASPIQEMPEADRAVLAVTTTFHRKRWKPERLDKEAVYQALPQDRKYPAQVLSALVRLADGLDYSGSQTTVLGSIQSTEEGITIMVTGPCADQDAARASEKADLWNALFRHNLSVTVHHDVLIAPAEAASEISLPARPGILPDDTMAEAGRKILGFHFSRMLYHEPGTREGTDIEALHDMRVATRRMRAAMRVFGKYYEAKTRERLLSGLRSTGQMLGQTRDLDVFMENAQQYLGTLPAERQHDLDLMTERWHKQREKAREEMIAYLDAKAYRAFTQSMAEFVGTPGTGVREKKSSTPRPIHVYTVAPGQVYTRYEALRAYQTVIGRGDINTLHQLRIEAKRMRYTLEFFQEVLGEESREVVSTLVRMQDHLGAWHDADVAQQILREHMDRIIKKARQQQKRSIEPVEQPDLSGIIAYLEHCERTMLALQETFTPVWEGVMSAHFRQQLARAVSVL
jgi:CHAD domain-containing protein/transposase